MSGSMIFCHGCGQKIHETAPACPNCGAYQRAQNSKDRITAGVLALLLGGVGIHKFYTGAWGWGLVYILFVWTFIPAIVAFIEGVRYFMLSDEEFSFKSSSLRPFSFLW